MKRIIVELNDGTEVTGYVQRERDTDSGVELQCVDAFGRIFDVTLTEEED